MHDLTGMEIARTETFRISVLESLMMRMFVWRAGVGFAGSSWVSFQAANDCWPKYLKLLLFSMCRACSDALGLLTCKTGTVPRRSAFTCESTERHEHGTADVYASHTRAHIDGKLYHACFTSRHFESYEALCGLLSIFAPSGSASSGGMCR